MDRYRPLVFGLGAVFVITLMNAMIKHLSPGYDVFQVAFLRYLSGGTFGLMLALYLRPGLPRAETVRPQLVRGVLGCLSGTSFFFALRFLSLADAFTIGFLAPLFVILFSLLFLKEKPRLVDIAGVALGFGGMLIIVAGTGGAGARPWLGIGAAALSALTYALSMTMLRTLAQKDAFIHIVLFQHWIATLLLAPAAVAVWQPLALADAALFFLAAALGVIGHLAFARGYSLAPASRMAPLEYTALIYAGAIDLIWFATVMSRETLIGAGLIILGVIVASRR